MHWPIFNQSIVNENVFLQSEQLSMSQGESNQALNTTSPQLQTLPIDALGPIPSPASDRPLGIVLPTYQQAIQLEPLLMSNQQSIPNEPPPEYSGPSLAYNETQSGGDSFHGESTMSTAEEQERMDRVEDEIGRLIAMYVQFHFYIKFKAHFQNDFHN